MHGLSLAQAAVAVSALVGITVLGVLGDISSDALVAIYAAVIGSALPRLNGSVSKAVNGRRNG